MTLQNSKKYSYIDRYIFLNSFCYKKCLGKINFKTKWVFSLKFFSCLGEDGHCYKYIALNCVGNFE